MTFELTVRFIKKKKIESRNSGNRTDIVCMESGLLLICQNNLATV